MEEQFYLAFPLALVLGWYLARRFPAFKSSTVVVAAIIGVGSFLIAIATSLGLKVPQAESLLGFYSSITRAWEFAAGALLALVASRVRLRTGRSATVLAVLGGGLLVASLWVITDTTPFPGIATLLPVVGTLLLIYAGWQPANVVSRALSTQPMVGLGNLSYSWYLWHWPLIVFAGFLWPASRIALVAAAILSLGPAIASYRWVEQPIRNLKTLRRPQIVKLVALTLTLPIVLSGLLLVAAGNGFWSRQVRDSKVAFLTTHGNCISTDALSARDLSKCHWNGSAAGAPIYLVGDSNADQFSEAVIEAGARLGRPVNNVTAPSCPLLEVRLRLVRTSAFGLVGAGFDTCPEYVDGVLSWLDHATPGLVIVAASDQYWWDPAVAVVGSSGTESVATAEKLGYLEQGLRATVARLEQAGHHVLIVQTIPHFWYPAPGWDPARCSLWTVLKNECARQLPQTVVDQVQSGSRLAMKKVASQTGATILHLRAYFCPDGTCSTQVHGISLYRNASHISSAASKALAPEFVGAIDGAARTDAQRLLRRSRTAEPPLCRPAMRVGQSQSRGPFSTCSAGSDGRTLGLVRRRTRLG